MSFLFQDFFSVFGVDYFRGRLNMLTETLLRQFVVSMSDSTCTTEALESCRDDSAALKLKLVAIASILAAGAAGIALPLIGRKRSFLATDSNLFVAAKAFAAGVILATGFVHMLPDGASNLSDPCLPTYPWSKFPFSSFFAMISALITLLADFVGTQLYERKQKRLNQAPPTVVAPVERAEGKVFGEEEDGGMHIVGMRAHAAHHQHTHPDGDRCGGGEAREGHVAREYEEDDVEEGAHAHGHSHSHGFGDSVGEGNARHVVVSQVLELGIVSHSVIIGLSLGVSHSPCTIRPLVAALSFHQFFEGFALGGCISQAQFKKLSTILMACFFAITTPAGISIGIGIASSYNPSSARSLVIEGILDSLSAGILVYMALVDLIAADFMSRRMRCNARLQIVSYLALFTGAVLMSALAIWS